MCEHGERINGRFRQVTKDGAVVVSVFYCDRMECDRKVLRGDRAVNALSGLGCRLDPQQSCNTKFSKLMCCSSLSF